MADDNSSLQIFECDRAGAKRMLREVKNSLNRGKPSTGYRLAMFVFTHEKEAMMFYYCDAPRTDLLTLMREFIRTLEDG